MRWGAPAAQAALPAAGAAPSPASSTAAAIKAALQQRLAAGCGVPRAVLLSPPGSSNGGVLPPGAPTQLPEDIYQGRIFLTKRETFSLCFQHRIFAGNK